MYFIYSVLRMQGGPRKEAHSPEPLGRATLWFVLGGYRATYRPQRPTNERTGRFSYVILFLHFLGFPHLSACFYSILYRLGPRC